MTREEAIGRIQEHIHIHSKKEPFTPYLDEAFNMAVEALEEQRPHGEWINKDYGIGKCWATCSECGESTNGEAQDNGFGYDYSFPNFCPNCGADMRKEGEKNE